MCLECEKKIFVKCIKSVHMEELEVFTKGEIYGVFSWYSDDEGCYNLTAINNRKEEHTISDGIEDDMTEYLKDEWFIEHFELISV